MNRSLQCAHVGGYFAGLVLEEIDRVAGMMPQQMVRPAARLAFGIHVGAAEKEGLYDQVLQLQFARFDSLVNPLMARVEAAGVSAHGHETRFFLDRENSFRVGE